MFVSLGPHSLDPGDVSLDLLLLGLDFIAKDLVGIVRYLTIVHHLRRFNRLQAIEFYLEIYDSHLGYLDALFGAGTRSPESSWLVPYTESDTISQAMWM